MNIWQKHLDEQDRLDVISDTSAFRNDPLFQSAGRVLDLGAGYGHRTAALATAFPHKMFVAVDNDNAALEFARKNFNFANLEFINADVEQSDIVDVAGMADYIVANLLVQHLRSIKQFSDTICALLNQGGCVLVVDAFEPFKRFIPNAPEYLKIFRDFRSYQLRTRNGFEVFDLPKFLKTLGFSVVLETVVCRSTDKDLDRNQLYKVSSTNLSAMEQLFDIEGDYEAAREELERWISASDSFGSLAQYHLQARKG